VLTADCVRVLDNGWEGEGRDGLVGGMSGKGVIERWGREGKGRKWKEGKGREVSPNILRYLLKNAND